MMNNPLAAGDNRLSGESRQKAHAVLSHVRCFFSGDLRGSGEEIHQGNELVTSRVGLNFTRPANNEGHPVPAVPEVRLGAAEVGADVMPLLAQGRNAGLLRATVVTGENHQGISARRAEFCQQAGFRHRFFGVLRLMGELSRPPDKRRKALAILLADATLAKVPLTLLSVIRKAVVYRVFGDRHPRPDFDGEQRTCVPFESHGVGFFVEERTHGVLGAASRRP